MNFGNSKQVLDFRSVGYKDISIFINRTRKRFAASLEERICRIISETYPSARISEVGFWHEGFHVDIDTGRLAVLSSAVHIWCRVDGKVREILDWLFTNAYDVQDNTV